MEEWKRSMVRHGILAMARMSLSSVCLFWSPQEMAQNRLSSSAAWPCPLASGIRSDFTTTANMAAVDSREFALLFGLSHVALIKVRASPVSRPSIPGPSSVVPPLWAAAVDRCYRSDDVAAINPTIEHHVKGTTASYGTLRTMYHGQICRSGHSPTSTAQPSVRSSMPGRSA